MNDEYVGIGSSPPRDNDKPLWTLFSECPGSSHGHGCRNRVPTAPPACGIARSGREQINLVIIELATIRLKAKAIERQRKE
jgi:hypothetical protein